MKKNFYGTAELDDHVLWVHHYERLLSYYTQTFDQLYMRIVMRAALNFTDFYISVLRLFFNPTKLHKNVMKPNFKFHHPPALSSHPPACSLRQDRQF